MLKLLVLLTLTSTFAMADEVLIAEVANEQVKTFTEVKTKFYVDFDARTVEAHASFIKSQDDCRMDPQGHDNCFSKELKLKTIRGQIEGLNLVDNKIIYSSKNGEVVCATLQEGSFFRDVTNVFATGSCRAEIKMKIIDGKEMHQLYFVSETGAPL
jgi:hypothetical protein